MPVQIRRPPLAGQVVSLALAVSLGLAFPAAGLTVAADSLAQQLANATLVAEIEVLRKESRPDPLYGFRYEAQARVSRVLLSRDPADRTRDGDAIRLGGPGGEGPELGVILPGFARPLVGRRYRAHLRSSSDGDYEIVGFEAGLEPLDTERKHSRNRTDGSNGDGTGPFLAWDKSFFPIPYFISSSTFTGRAEYISAIDASFATWRSVGDTTFEFLAMGCTSIARNGNDGINTIIFSADDWPFDPAAIAITRNFYIAGTTAKAGQILDSDILLNGVDHDFSVDSSPGTHDVQNIVTHEVGHFLGLGHEVAPTVTDAVMHAVASVNETKKRTLHANDIAGVTEAYPGAGKRFAAAPKTQHCATTSGTSCLAVHERGSRPGWGTASLAIALLFALGAGRLLDRAAPRPGHLSFFISCFAFDESWLFGKRSTSSW